MKPSSQPPPPSPPRPRPGRDLIGEALKKGTFRRADLGEVVTRWLEKQLLAEQYARLEQAGHSPEGKIPLARVFIDIPAPTSPTMALDNTSDERPGFVAELLRMKPVSLAGRRAPPTRRTDRKDSKQVGARPWKGHFVLIGGPGQGKSTMGQHLCQIYRASVLGARADRLTPQGRTLVRMIETEQERDHLGPPEHLAFPVRIELGEFAAWMANEETPVETTVLLYLGHHIEKRTGAEVPIEDLRAFLAECPVLLVLDGLDEVPPAAGRGAMIEAIIEFRQGLAALGALGLVVATTRPQGYSGDFEHFESRHLARLSRGRALEYAKRLIEVRYYDQVERSERILSRLERAIADASTTRLMESPLQVTIMVTLVDRIGEPPQQRWALFNKYYEILCDREMERPTPAAELLRDHGPHVHEVHHRVGLLLQVESERSGGSEALMSRERIDDVVDTVLSEAGYDANQRTDIGRSIVDAATERLVFLVSPQDDKFGFEIRPLQEMMAAEALLTGREDQVGTRLRQIATSDMWRNVVLFAASKVFTASGFEHLRDLFIGFCDELDTSPGDESARVVFAGARLALDVINEGAVLKFPRYARRLGEYLGRLLDLPPLQLHIDLALGFLQLLGAGLPRDTLEELLRDKVTSRHIHERTSAWTTLVLFIEAGDFEGIGNDAWPEAPDEQRIIVEAYDRDWAIGPWLQNKISGARDSFDPNFIGALTLSEESEADPLLEACHSLITAEPQVVALRDDIHGLPPIPLSLISLERPSPGWSALANLSDPPPTWVPWVAAGRFALNPTARELAAGLECVAARYDLPSIVAFLTRAPWPFAACLNDRRGAEGLSHMARSAFAGDLGDMVQWFEAERSLIESGIAIEDFLKSFAEGAPFVTGVFRIGLLPTYLQPLSGFNSADLNKWITRLLELRDNVQSAEARFHLAMLTWKLLATLDDLFATASMRVTPAQVERLFLDTNDMFAVPLPLHALRPLMIHTSMDPDWFAVLDRVGSANFVYSRRHGDKFNEYLIRGYLENRTRSGLLALACTTTPWTAAALPEELLDPDKYEHPDVAVAIIWLRLARLDCTSSEIERWVDRIVTSGRLGVLVLSDLTSLHFASPAQREAFFLSLRRHVPLEHWDIHAEIQEILADTLAHRPSGIDDPATWDRLGLPSPRPAPPPPPALPAGPEPGIVDLRSLEIDNLRALDAVTITPPELAATTDAGRWIVILGENGMGKSTLLRAIVLALATPSITNGLLSSSTAPFRRNGAEFGEVRAQVGPRSFRTRIKPKEDAEIPEHFAAEHARHPFLFAYGCRRGSALGGSQKEVSFTPLAEVVTLFDESEGLIHAETWLTKLRLAAALGHEKKDERPRQVFDAVIEVLRTVLPGVDRIEVEADHAYLWGPDVGERVPLSALSDGYLTTLGWVVDLVARWMNRRENLGRPLEASFNKTMEGLVLVDELDLHLHPRWQIRAIDDLRKAFPRVSFVVTTHNPLTLLGARDGEIFVLRRDGDDGPIRAEQQNLPKGLRADQVLTGPWFGLATTLDAETRKLLDDHRDLLRARVPETDRERLRIEAELRRRLGTFAETSLERLALQVAAELMEEGQRDLTPEERAALRDKVKARVRARRDARKG